MSEINNIFVEVPNRDTYEEYKEEINPDSLVFIKDEDRMVANDDEYLFVHNDGFIKLYDGDDNVVETIPILKLKIYGYGGYDEYSGMYSMIGEWDN